MTLLAAALLLVVSPLSTPSDSRAAVVVQPRAYGYVLGDVLTQRVLLEDSAGRRAVPIAPVVARVNAWFDRLPSHVEADTDGHPWLHLDYQVINVSGHVELGSLPALTVSLKDGADLQVPEWPVSIGPLTPEAVYDKGDLLPMRPDHPATPYSTTQVERMERWWSGLLGLTVVLWMGWFFWRNQYESTRLPFARALRLTRRAGHSTDMNAAWVALHRAFNDTAGQVMQPETLPVLFERAPWLLPLRADIEEFFASSSERFFARVPAARPVELVDLSRALRHAEKRNGHLHGL